MGLICFRRRSRKFRKRFHCQGFKGGDFRRKYYPCLDREKACALLVKIVIFWYNIIGVTKYGRRRSPLLIFEGGKKYPPIFRKEGDAMYITLSDLIQIGILIVGIIGLFQQAQKK